MDELVKQDRPEIERERELCGGCIKLVDCKTQVCSVGRPKQGQEVHRMDCQRIMCLCSVTFGWFTLALNVYDPGESLHELVDKTGQNVRMRR